MTIAIKRVYDPPGLRDGQRVLVDRLWPRGLRKADAAMDVWMKDLAPSPALRKWFDHREDRFREFRSKYLLELKSNPAVDDILPLIRKRKVTLLYGARDTAINHAVVLAQFLDKKTRV